MTVRIGPNMRKRAHDNRLTAKRGGDLGGDPSGNAEYDFLDLVGSGKLRPLEMNT